MQSILKRWTDGLLDWLGASSAQHEGWDRWVAFALVLLITLLFDFLCRLLIVNGVRRIVQRTRAKWDDKLFNPKVLNRLCHILSAVLLAVVLPVVFEERSVAREVVLRLMQSYIVITVFRFVSVLLYAAFQIASDRPAWENKPIKGLRQTAQGTALLISVILIVSILMNKSPTILLTGLGASAAILLLVFRDSILGFVSGIQLAANDMLKVGDWISVEKYGVDGNVIEVTLTTVKVRNWDNTIVTLPPYLLVSESFQNWQAMKRSGGRRVMRSVAIDMTSVRFCTPEMIEKFRGIDLVREYIEQMGRQNEAFNKAHAVTTDGSPANGLHLTNLGVFRAYLVKYLRTEVPVNKDMTLMVRQLQPTETGIPVQLYFFTDTVEWIAYEGIQSDVFDHVLAVIPEFGLRVFQYPAGSDLEALRPGRPDAERGNAAAAAKSESAATADGTAATNGAATSEGAAAADEAASDGKVADGSAPEKEPGSPSGSAVAGSGQSTTGNGRAVAGSGQPAAGSGQPVAGNDQPAAESGQSGAGSKQPAAGGSEEDHQHDLDHDDAQEHRDGVDRGV